MMAAMRDVMTGEMFGETEITELEWTAVDSTATISTLGLAVEVEVEVSTECQQ